MKRSTIVIVACLLIGIVVGYGTGYLVYEPKIRNLEAQVSNLTTEVANLNNTVSNQQIQILTLNAQKDSLAADLNRANMETERYKGQVTTLQLQASKLESELSSLEGRLSNIFNSRLTQYYGWTYQGRTWQWEVPIPLSLYVEYLERPRPSSGASYVDMAKDPKDDSYIDQLIQKINSAAAQEGFTEFQKLNFVIAFVQSLPYTVDIETTPYDEYPRYPVETLIDKGGDCEDTSILVAALLDRMGYDVALLLLRDAQHMAVGVSIPDAYGSYYQYNNKKYFYLETTGEGWEIGQIPPDITNTKASIYPLRG